MVRLRRQRAERVRQADREVLPLVRHIKARHPFWGYRRVWAGLKFVHGLAVNKKRIYRLMKENDLLVKDNEKLKAARSASTRKPKPERPNQWWGIDMTKVITSEGWAYVVIVNDWFTKKILGTFVGSRSQAADWLEAVNQAVCRQFPKGIKESRTDELNLMSDNGSQPTSLKFMQAAAELGIRQAFTAYANPKGNANTERLIRTLKEELLWLREWITVEEVARAVKEFAPQFNAEYLHSTLGYKTPDEFEKQWFAQNQKTLSATA